MTMFTDDPIVQSGAQIDGYLLASDATLALAEVKSLDLPNVRIDIAPNVEVDCFIGTAEPGRTQSDVRIGDTILAIDLGNDTASFWFYVRTVHAR